jgi:hypothetical protein
MVRGLPKYRQSLGYALMPTREEALQELTAVLNMIAEEYAEKATHCPPILLKS